MHVAFCVNNKFVTNLTVAIWTILSNLEFQEFIVFHIVAIRITPHNKKKIKNVLNHFPAIITEVIWYEPIMSFEDSFGDAGNSAIARLFLPKLLPQSVDKVIYLDSDILVLSNLNELWETENYHNMLLAVQDEYIKNLSSPGGVNYAIFHYNLDPSAPYFNSGVLLLSLQKMREQEILKKCISHLQNPKFINNYWDQDVLNIFSYGLWDALDKRWNYQLAGLLKPICDTSLNVPNNNVSIVHFTSLKPSLGFPFHKLEIRMLKKTSFIQSVKNFKKIFDFHL